MPPKPLITSFVVLIATVVLMAQAPPSRTATDPAASYLAYRRAFIKAKTLDDSVPLISSARRKELASLTKEEKDIHFNTMKATDDIEQITVRSTSCSGTQCRLQLTGRSEQAVTGKPTNVSGVATIVKERNSFYLESETWRP